MRLGWSLVFLLGLLGCAGTVKQAAKEAAPAAVESAIDEARDPETRSDVAEILADPEIREAARGLSEAVLSGAFEGLTQRERAAELGRMTEAFVGTVGASLARSLRNDIGPQLSATFAEAVDQSLTRALDAQTEARVQAMAVAVARGTMQGLGEVVIDPMTGQPSPLMSHIMGQFAREMARQGALGFEEAVHVAGESDETGLRERRGGSVLAAAGQLSDLVLGLPLLLMGGVLLLMLAGGLTLAWAVWRLRHHQRMSRAHEEAALALARAIKATENAAWSEELRSHIARATRDGVGGAELRKLLRDHDELQLRPRDAPPRSDGPAYAG